MNDTLKYCPNQNNEPVPAVLSLQESAYIEQLICTNSEYRIHVLLYCCNEIDFEHVIHLTSTQNSFTYSLFHIKGIFGVTITSTDLVDPYGENTFSVKPPLCT